MWYYVPRKKPRSRFGKRVKPAREIAPRPEQEPQAEPETEECFEPVRVEKFRLVWEVDCPTCDWMGALWNEELGEWSGCPTCRGTGLVPPGTKPRLRVKTPSGHRRRMVDEFPFCQWCGVPVDLNTATIDHIVPTSKGGSYKLKNMCLACRTCNNRKADNDWGRPPHGPVWHEIWATICKKPFKEVRRD